LGSFWPSNRVTSFGPGPVHPRQLCYLVKGRSLGIYPHLGFIEYRDESAATPLETQNVPDKPRSLALATNLLRTLGIDLSQLTPEPSFRSTISYRSKQFVPGSRTTNIISSSLSFCRAIDGVPFYLSAEGCSLTFGHDAKISKLELSWRNLERGNRYAVATPQKLLQSIRDGKSFTQVFGSPLRFPRPGSIKRLSIVRISPYYFGENPEDSQDTVEPFAYLETKADLLETNTVILPGETRLAASELTNSLHTVVQGLTNETIFICCPMLDDTPKAKN
jgi:hypothetical protein